MRKLGKRGSVLTDNLIWIILGLLLLVLLLWFTVPQFRDIMSKIFGFATDNKDTIAQNCNLKCSTLQKNAFCCADAGLKAADGTPIIGSCNALRGQLPSLNCPSDFCSDANCP